MNQLKKIKYKYSDKKEIIKILKTFMFLKKTYICE